MNESRALPRLSAAAAYARDSSRRPHHRDHLLDALATPKQALAELYQKRWHIELDLRCIKTTLGMDVLRCLTPAMVEKELWVHLLAYNLIRLLMAQAAAEHSTAPRALSFQHTVQLWSKFTSRAVLPELDSAAALQTLFRLIAQ